MFKEVNKVFWATPDALEQIGTYIKSLSTSVTYKATLDDKGIGSFFESYNPQVRI